MSKTYEQITAGVTQIKNAGKKENTKERIGDQFQDTLDYAKDVADRTTDLEHEVGGLYDISMRCGLELNGVSFDFNVKAGETEHQTLPFYNKYNRDIKVEVYLGLGNAEVEVNRTKKTISEEEKLVVTTNESVIDITVTAIDSSRVTVSAIYPDAMSNVVRRNANSMISTANEDDVEKYKGLTVGDKFFVIDKFMPNCFITTTDTLHIVKGDEYALNELCIVSSAPIVIHASYAIVGEYIEPSENERVIYSIQDGIVVCGKIDFV